MALCFLCAEPREVLYSYNLNDYLEEVTDLLGNTTLYTYTPEGQLATITDQRGVTIVTNTYDAEGRVIEQLDGRNNLTTLAYDTPVEDQTTITQTVMVVGDSTPHTLLTVHTHEALFNLLTSIENPEGFTITFTYDQYRNRDSITDRNSHTTIFTYDERGNITYTAEHDDPADPYDGGVTSVEYANINFPDLPTKKTDALGYVTEWTYDDYGNVFTETRWLDLAQTENVTSTWSYNSFGQPTTQIDERGNVYTWVYDADGLLQYEIDQETNYTWYDYDELWRLSSVTNGRGSGPGDPAYTTTFVYDDADRITEVTSPLVGSPPHPITIYYDFDNIGNKTGFTDGNGNPTSWVYDENSNPIEMTDAELGLAQYVYDELNRMSHIIDANSNESTFIYNDDDTLWKMLDADDNLWEYHYDDHGNLMDATDPSNVTVFHEYDALNRRTHTYDELGHGWRFEYDKLGRLTKNTNPKDLHTLFLYDGLGRLIEVIDAAEGSTEYTYDATSNLTQIEDANDHVISFREYYDNNLLKKATDGIGCYYEYGYDPVGNQIWVQDAKQETTLLTHDAESRLIRIDYPDATQVTYEYDDNSNLLEMTDPTGTSSYTYDDLNRLLTSTDSLGHEVEYGYDPVGNRISLTYPDDKVVTYHYDDAYRLRQIIDWAARTTFYEYTGMQLDSVLYPNGVEEVRGYDVAGRLISLDTEKSDTTALLNISWERDELGSPTSCIETGTLAPDLNHLLNDTYQYDTDNRLDSSTHLSLIPQAHGQREAKGPGHQGLSSNQMSMAPTVTRRHYEHDANGNMTKRPGKDGLATFAYDCEDRLVSQASGTRTVEHVYDGFGNRIERIENGESKRFVLDRGRSMSHVLCEMDDTGALTAYYIHGPMIVVRIDASETEERYYHTNDIGNVIALTDETEAITDRYAYTPFGTPCGQEGTTENLLTYVGGLGVMMETDGLFFMRARFYDPAFGRFLGKDPVEGYFTNPQGLHKYVYGVNNAEVMVDPSGLQYDKFPEGISKSNWNDMLNPHYQIPNSQGGSGGAAGLIIVEKIGNAFMGPMRAESALAAWNRQKVYGRQANSAVNQVKNAMNNLPVNQTNIINDQRNRNEPSTAAVPQWTSIYTNQGPTASYFVGAPTNFYGPIAPLSCAGGPSIKAALNYSISSYIMRQLNPFIGTGIGGRSSGGGLSSNYLSSNIITSGGGWIPPRRKYKPRITEIEIRLATGRVK